MAYVSDTDLDRSDASHLSGDVSDFVTLLKPKVMSLVVFTALVGLVMAPGGMHPLLAAVSVLCIAVGAGASGALNMWYDADIDAQMGRTNERPIPRGVVAPPEALAFGIVLSVFSVGLLGLVSNWMAAGFLAFTIFFYSVVYTMWLKRWTPQNIVIGGAAGAFPPMIGWMAVTGGFSVESFVLFLIIFLWTPPHFWALALLKTEDYARVGVPMLPVVKGDKSTRLQIVMYSVAMAVAGVLPTVLGFSGLTYGVIASLAGLVFVALSVRIYRAGDAAAARQANLALFGYSILYLFGLFAVLLVEHGMAGVI
ncbi:MAG: heme o synthase [Pseudomonadota bacterium]